MFYELFEPKADHRLKILLFRGKDVDVDGWRLSRFSLIRLEALSRFSITF